MKQNMPSGNVDSHLKQSTSLKQLSHSLKEPAREFLTAPITRYLGLSGDEHQLDEWCQGGSLLATLAENPARLTAFSADEVGILFRFLAGLAAFHNGTQDEANALQAFAVVSRFIACPITLIHPLPPPGEVWEKIGPSTALLYEKLRSLKTDRTEISLTDAHRLFSSLRGLQLTLPVKALRVQLRRATQLFRAMSRMVANS